MYFRKEDPANDFYKSLFKTIVDIPKFKHELINSELKLPKSQRYQKYHLFLISIILCKPSLVEYFYNYEEVSKIEFLKFDCGYFYLFVFLYHKDILQKLFLSLIGSHISSKLFELDEDEKYTEEIQSCLEYKNLVLHTFLYY